MEPMDHWAKSSGFANAIEASSCLIDSFVMSYFLASAALACFFAMLKTA